MQPSSNPKGPAQRVDAHPRGRAASLVGAILATLCAATAALALASAAHAALAVSAAGEHSCGLTDAGGVQCWGTNRLGQLGDGTTEVRYTPTPVIGLSSGVTAIASGGQQTCALTEAGGVECWGDNRYGQLGDGTTESRDTPTQVVGLTSGVAAISVGGRHTCALTEDARILCWGVNEHGQLGDKTTEMRLTPVPVPVPSAGYTAVAAGQEHTCALTGAGAVLCWGENEHGQLGDGTTEDRDTPTQVTGLTSGITAIAAGYNHSCALTAQGADRCWGDDEHGELGDGTNGAGNNRYTPTQVSGLTSGVTAIGAGKYHSCALTAAGGVKCWTAFNSYGQVGDGTKDSHNTPTQVSGLTSGVTAITLGYNHSCALTGAGKILCWGINHGRLGDGTDTERDAPTAIAGFGQTIAFPQPSGHVLGEGDAEPGAVASSGLPVAYTSQTPAVCTIVSARIHLVAPGECTVTAEQDGDEEYVGAAAAVRTFVVAKAVPALSGQAPGEIALGAPIPAIATISGGYLPGGTITFRAYGPGDATCAGTPAYVSGAVPVSGDGTFAAAPAFTPTATGIYNFTVEYSGDADNQGVAAGACATAGQTAVTVTAPTPSPSPTSPSPPSSSPPSSSPSTPAGPATATLAAPPTVHLSQGPDRPQGSGRAGGLRYTFRFEGQAPGTTFLCSLDGAAFRPCTSPKAYRNLRKGRHVFRVRSVDSKGVESATEEVVFKAGGKAGHRRGR